MGNKMIKSIPFSSKYQYKMALVIRTDIGMSKGKIAAQCCHAAIGCYQKTLKTNPNLINHWERQGVAKITLKVNGDAQVLNDLEQKALKEGLIAFIVRDAGYTQVEYGTTTVLGIGPGPVEAVDKVTKHLKLY